MPSSSSAALQAISLEIGRAPRMALLEDPMHVPAVPEGPAVLVVDLGLADFPIPHRRPFGRLMETLVALIRNEPTPWLIEAHEPQSFARAYRTLLESIQSDRDWPVLLYVPHHGSRVNFKLAQDELVRTRSMLELFGYHASGEEADDDSPDATPLDAARQRRAQLLKEEHWLDAGKVHELQQGGSSSSPGANNTASRLRRRGELLGAWDGREYAHPAFQFDHQTGRLMPEMKELLELLPKDRSGWRQTFWLFQPHALLHGKRPADVFRNDPQSVIEAASSTFSAGNTNW